MPTSDSHRAYKPTNVTFVLKQLTFVLINTDCTHTTYIATGSVCFN